MSASIKFYQGSDNRIGIYSYDSIVNNWSNSRLQSRKDYIHLLFPMKEELTKMDLVIFSQITDIRHKVIHAVLRFINLYGFDINDSLELVKINEINRKEGNVVVGLHNPINYEYITRMMSFLNAINMELLSIFVFLTICRSIKEDFELKKKIQVSNILPKWVSMYHILDGKLDKINNSLFDIEVASWERSSQSVELVDNIVKKQFNDAW